MSLTLTPIGNSDLATLSLTEGMLAVGRNDEPFSSYPRALSGRLSRRHARLFFEDGKYYVGDLGSRNGTYVNSQRVGSDPVVIRSGDEVNFGGDIKYLAAVEKPSESETAQLAKLNVTLEPKHPQSGVLRVVFQQLPVLIGKGNEPFSAYAKAYPDEVAFLSRRHAHIFSRDGKLFIEDLGSTNGTYVNEQRLEEEPHALSGGEIVAFGGDFFVFTVSLGLGDAGGATQVIDADATRVLSAKADPVQPASPATSTGQAVVETPNDDSKPTATTGNTPAPAAVAAEAEAEAASAPQADEPKTVFVSSATSFLDILCSEQADNDPDGADAQREGAGSNARGSGAQGQAGTSGRWVARIAALVFVVVAVAGIIYLLPKSDESKIESLIDAGKYQQAAELGNEALPTADAESNLATLTDRALMNHVVPAWTTHLDAAEFDAAKAVLAEAEPLTSNNPRGARLLKLLGWISEQYAFVAEHGGSEIQIAIYKDEPALKALLSGWEADETNNRRSLQTISTYVPQFATTSRDMYSRLRNLRAAKSLYVTAINELSTGISKKLRASMPQTPEQRERTLEAVSDDIANFRSKYPAVTGVDALDTDLQQYREVMASIDARKLAAVTDQLESNKPSTEPFISHYEWMTASYLPSGDFLAGYRRAVSAWQAGDTALAITELDKLDATAWDGLAANKKAHFQQVSDAFAQLNANKGADDYTDRLITFNAMLDQNADSYFSKAVAGDFHAASSEIATKADALFDTARGHWRAFHDAGGIDGGIRIQPTITDAYREQTTRLSEALSTATQAAQLYSSIGKTLQPNNRDLHTEIKLEIKRQRMWLNDLGMVMGPTLTQEKLALLPSVEEENAE